MAKYGYVGLLWLFMSIWDYVGLCRAVYGYVGLCRVFMTMYTYVGLCMAM